MSLVVNAQFKKWVLGNDTCGKNLTIKHKKEIDLIRNGTWYSGHIVSIHENSLVLRVKQEDPDLLEKTSISKTKGKPEKFIAEGWQRLPQYANDSATYNFKDSIYFTRSTVLQTILLQEIESITYQKSDRCSGGGLEAIALPLALLSTPIWNYTDGQFDWVGFSVIAGVNIVYFGSHFYFKKRCESITYDMQHWKTMKVR